MSEEREDLIRRLRAAEADRNRERKVQKIIDEAPPVDGGADGSVRRNK